MSDERLGCQPFSRVNLWRNSESSSVVKNDLENTSHMQALGTRINNDDFEKSTIALRANGSRFPTVCAVAPPAIKASSRECHSQQEGISLNPAERVKPHMFFGDRSFTVSKPFQDHFTESTSHVVPYEFDHGEYRVSSRRTAEPSSMCREKEISQLRSITASKKHLSNTNLTIIGHEHCNYDRHSAFLVSEKKMGNHSGKSETPYLSQKNVSPFNDSSTSNNHSPPVFAEEKYQRMQSCSGTGLFPSRSSPPEMTKSEELHHGCYSLQRLPQSVHDVETTRICTAVDSVGVLPGGPSRFSQTTHSLLITRKTDINLCDENEIFRESRVSSQFAGNMFNLHSPFPLFGSGQRGVNLQLLGSSTDSEEKKNAEDFKASELVCKNESSAETDTMDMDAFMEKNHISSGVNFSPSNKDIMVDTNLSLESTSASSREVGRGQSMGKLPDINVEFPPLPVPASSMGNAEPSTSRTQSLDMEFVLSHAEQSITSKSNCCPDDRLISEPSSRWIKRLKLSTSDSIGLGTKSSHLGEDPSHEKANKFFNKATKGSMNSSEPMLGKSHGKALVRNDDSSSEETKKKGRDITLSHSWIQRWIQNRAAIPQKKPAAVVVCEPQCSNLSDDFQKKQFPSIAAMALMGKTMSGFQPCEIRKRDSFVVWNTRGTLGSYKGME